MSEFLDLSAVAERLAVTPSSLRRLAGLGQFPEVLRVARGIYRVRRIDYESWEAARWTKAEQARADLAWARTKQLLRGEG